MSMEEPTTKEAPNVGNALRYGIPLNYRWLVEFVLLPIIIAGFGMWLTSTSAKIADLQVEVAKLNNFQTENRTNINNLDSKIDTEVTGRLDRIENKLDVVIERQLGFIPSGQ